MKISHEIPKQLFNQSKLFNDYPYVLGHLIKLDSEYKEFYKEELQKAEFSILDNSAFELGKSIPFEELISVTRELRPTHLVLPDTIHNKETTLKNSVNFFIRYQKELKDLEVKPIGVTQGNSFQDLFECIETYLKHGINYIAIPFDCIKGTDYGTIRFQFFRYLVRKLDSDMKRKLKIHFLGLQNPQELLLYTKIEKGFINSIDSSSPILHGVVGNSFTEWGTNEPKPKLKLADNLDIEILPLYWEIIKNNINHFKKFCNE